MRGDVLVPLKGQILSEDDYDFTSQFIHRSIQHGGISMDTIQSHDTHHSFICQKEQHIYRARNWS